MSTEEVRRFVAAVRTDPALRTRIDSALASAGEPVLALGAVARAEGYSVRDDELKVAVQRAEQELTDEDLERIAGGAASDHTRAVYGAGVSSPLLKIVQYSLSIDD